MRECRASDRKSLVLCVCGEIISERLMRYPILDIQPMLKPTLGTHPTDGREASPAGLSDTQSKRQSEHRPAAHVGTKDGCRALMPLISPSSKHDAFGG